MQTINYQEKSGKICQKSYLTRRHTEPEYETEKRPGGPHLCQAWAQPWPRLGGAASSGRPLASLYAYKLPSDLKTYGDSRVFQKKFRSAAATRNQDSDPETPFWHPTGTGNLERIIAIVITNASPSTTDVSLIHEWVIPRYRLGDGRDWMSSIM